MSWYRAPLRDLRPDIISCRNVAVWNLRSCIYGAPSLTRGQVWNLLCNHSMVRVAQNPKPYFTVSSETPPIWRTRFPYLYPPGTGWPSYTSGTGFPLRRLLRLGGLRWRYSNPLPTWKLKFKLKLKLLYDRQSVSQYVLVSSTLVGLVTRYYFLLECCCLKFAVLFLWVALPDERTGLQFAV
jgi:hypothetical protein